jgi:hypothetical protein
MKVKELIDILTKCNPEANIGTFANNHWNDSSHYGSHGGISVAERNSDIIIGNFNMYVSNDQFKDEITFWHKDYRRIIL